MQFIEINLQHDSKRVLITHRENTIELQTNQPRMQFTK